VIQYQKGKTNLDFTGARDSEWQWHRLGHTKSGTQTLIKFVQRLHFLKQLKQAGIAADQLRHF